MLRARADRSRPGHIWVLLEDVTELRRLQRIRTEFIDNLSHELRTPLTTIRLLTERLTDELATLDVPARVRERVATIDVETGHLVQMVNELLDLSRIEQAATQLHLDDVAVGPLLAAGTARLRAFADRQGVEIRLALPARRCRRSGVTPSGWASCCSTCSTTRSSSRVPAGVVTVGATQQGLEVVMTVADQGVGIPRADQPRIFERFFKVDRARERGQGGTGLGSRHRPPHRRGPSGPDLVRERGWSRVPRSSWRCPSRARRHTPWHRRLAGDLPAHRGWVERPGRSADTSWTTR